MDAIKAAMLNKLGETVSWKEKDTQVLPASSEDYGESLLYRAIWAHFKYNSNTLDALAYVTDIEETGTGIRMYLMYWTKYAQLVIDRGNSRAGWWKRTKSPGVGLVFDIDIAGDIDDALITVSVQYKGSAGNQMFRMRNGEVCILDEEGAETSSPVYTNGTNEFSYCEDRISKIMHEGISAVIKAIYENLVEVQFELTGYTQMF